MKKAKKKPGRLKASILDWLGIPINLTHTDAPFWSEWAAGSSDSGQTVTATTAMRLSAVWACVRLISETISTLPLNLYERSTTGPRVAERHPLQIPLHVQPNPNSTAAVHWEATVAAMLLRGNARSEMLMLGDRIIGLRFLAPDRLTIRSRGQGRLEYWYLEDNGQQRQISSDRIWNIPGFSLDGQYGCSVVTYAVNVFGSAQAADQAANKTFEKGLMPTTAFKFPQVLTPDQRADAREAITTISGALNAGKPAIFEAGTDSMQIGIAPKDAQLLESRGWSVEEVCRWFRTPPWMIGHGEKSTSWGTGIEQQMIGFLTFTLAPWLRRIEQSIQKDLLAPAERMRYYAKFSVEGLLRADSAARATFYAAMVNNGIRTRDEVRALEDLEPMGGNAAKLTVQSAMTTLDSLGDTSGADQARSALMAWLKDEPQE